MSKQTSFRPGLRQFRLTPYEQTKFPWAEEGCTAYTQVF